MIRDRELELPVGEFDRALGLTLAMQAFLPLMHAVEWLPEPVRGALAAIFLLIGGGFFVVVHFTRKKIRVAKLGWRPAIGRGSRGAPNGWSGYVLYLGINFLVLGAGLGLRRYGVLLTIAVVQALIYFWAIRELRESQERLWRAGREPLVPESGEE